MAPPLTSISATPLPRTPASGGMSSFTSPSPQHAGHSRAPSSVSYVARTIGRRTPYNRSSTAPLESASRRRLSSAVMDRNHALCAVSESRGVSPSVGIAYINSHTGEALLSQIDDMQFYSKTVQKLCVLEPSKILVANTAAAPPNPKYVLLDVIEREHPGIPIVHLPRRYWSEAAGLEFVQRLAFHEDVESIKFALDGKFFATCCFSAVVNHLHLDLAVTISSNTLKIRYRPPEDSMMIDLATIQALELIRNLQDVKSNACLLGLLNHTKTPMGLRMLRSNILQPSTAWDSTIANRHAAVDELTTCEEMFFEVRKALGGFEDAEKTLTELTIIPQEATTYNADQAVNKVLLVRSFLEAFPALFQALGPANSPLLTQIRSACDPRVMAEARELISSKIQDDVIYAKTPLDRRLQRVHAVKAGIDSRLDAVRAVHCNVTGSMYRYVEQFSDGLNLVSDVRYDDARGFYLRFPAAEFEGRQIPDQLINRIKKKDYIECQTLELRKMNQRIFDSAIEIMQRGNDAVQRLIRDLHHHARIMFTACEFIALLDMLASFADVATKRDYVRPQLGPTLALKSARHPIVELPRPEKFVPNDYFATETSLRFQIITGCNMSGKSTSLRTIGLLQIMAQIGSFVPARFATFPVIHKLFSRMSTDDSIEGSLSTFSVEMRETAFILRNIDSKSLAIIDELGRGTSQRDGLAIAIAISEALVQSGALVFFATHFAELPKVFADRPGIKTMHHTTQTTQPARPTDMPTVTMLFRLAEGPVNDTHYGLQLASAVGFPARFMETAKRVADRLAAQAAQNMRNSEAHKLAERRKLMFRLHDTLVQVNESGMDGGALNSLLKTIQAQFVQQMEALGVGDADESGGAGHGHAGNGDGGRQRRENPSDVDVGEEEELGGGIDEMMD